MLKLKLKVDIEIEFPCIPTIVERDGEGRVGGRLLECHACLTFWPGARGSAYSRKYGILEPLTSRRLRVRCLGSFKKVIFFPSCILVPGDVKFRVFLASF